MTDRPVLTWLAGGLSLAGVLLFTVATVKPIGVSTQYVRAAGGLVEMISPDAAAGNTYFQEEKITFGYAEMLVLSVPLGPVLPFLLLVLFGVVWCYLALFGPKNYFC